MRCFVIEPGGSEILNPHNPEAEKIVDYIPLEIVLGNAKQIKNYFAVERIGNRYYVTAVPKHFHDDTNPLGDRRHPETDIV